MRILAVSPGPSFSVEDVHQGWLRAFERAGHQVYDLRMGERLEMWCLSHLEKNGEWHRALDFENATRLANEGIEAVAYRWWPDVVMITSGFYVSPSVLEILTSRHLTVLVCTESPYEDDEQVARAANVDVVTINDPTNLARFQAINPNTFYIPAAHDPELHCPGPSVPSLEADFGWVGTGYPSRTRFFESVDWADLTVKLGGNWQNLAKTSPLIPFLFDSQDDSTLNSATIDLYRSVKLSANTYRIEAERPEHIEGWACGPREIELAATGTFFLRQSRPESDELFPMLPTFESPEEFGDLARWWSSHDKEREHAADLAREAVKSRTFDSNVAWLMSQIPARAG